MSVEDASDDHGGHHHLPAVEDWPRGFGEASWWPFITALGGAGLYVGAALFVLGHGENSLVGPMAGPGVFVASTFLFLAGLYGWLYHAFVVNFWDGDGHSKGLRLGMVSWPPSHIPHGFLGSLVIINTALLLVSSVTLHYAHVALRKGNRTRFIQLLAATLLLGVVFLGGQVYEYYEFIIVEGFTLTEGVFASAFFGLTGLHGLHVSLGAVLLGIVFIRSLKGQYDAERHTSVSTVSMYWHFVDAVWVFLVVVLYVGAVYSL
jgi:cytochrome c oxidase subunit 3